jgi:hypothetical protein
VLVRRTGRRPNLDALVEALMDPAGLAARRRAFDAIHPAKGV